MSFNVFLANYLHLFVFFFNVVVFFFKGHVLVFVRWALTPCFKGYPLNL